jgi:hypothetical protein
MAGRTRFLPAVALALAIGVAPSSAQDATFALNPSDARPFVVGERLSYNVRVGRLGKGTAVAELKQADTVRGQPVYHSVFQVNGSLLFFKVKDHYESWFDPRSLVSLRYHQNIDQGAYERLRKYEIFPERGVYYDSTKALELATVEKPLDDGSFLYFLRTVPLQVGKTYSFNRYFKPDRNPVTITVLRRERIRVPAGEFDAVVLAPKIKAKGIFAEASNAEVWIADDDTRMMLQLRTKLPTVGTVVFQLRSRELLKGTLAERPEQP